MAQRITEEFVRLIPKTELHVHLDGSLRIPTLIELAKAGKVKLPAYSEEGLRKKVFKDFYKDLPDYLAGFGYTCAVMQNAENVERIAYELAVDHLAEGVRYVEVRFAPQLHAHEDFSMEDVVRATARGFERAQKEHNRSPDVKAGRDIPFHFGIILCALRFFNEYMSPYYAAISRVMPFAPRKQIIAAASQELARAAAVMKHELGLPVVAFDLAGAEAGYPAEDHKAAFQFAHSNFIRKTVHAGEAYGPESIFQAITDCYADRLGHGTWLFADEMVRNPAIEDPKAYVHNLVDYIASQRICIEVCLTSNLQTLPHMKSIAKHPLRKMLDHGLSVSICTDNRLMSNTTVTNEIMLAVKHLNLTQRELRNVIVAGFKGSFFPGDYTEKRAYVRQVIDRYEQLKAEHLK
ncbi:MAG: adenosine deaminase family protein [Kiritimatiellae bacterium]|nr:adenosine deaminase family protein [Kiritimatiellia bacterium]MCO5062011.1 adenosine deaminase family protein [Kiritimatiellia bacterium]MCO5069298.1 adenosine deaminase family protein [Kiritimatiellia bacterium]MCO6400262.1 adenosine deaminase family protein [Verrucomicrobiota bacterium]